METIIGIGVGAILTVIVTRYYFQKGNRTSLTIYVHNASRLFRGVEDDLRRSLSVSFRRTDVSDLIDIRLLVANQGNNPIGDCVEPLRIRIPDKARLLDAALLHVSPDGRSIDVGVNGQVVECAFPLLNPGEFFLIKLLLDGDVGPWDLTYSIVAGHLPPFLRPEMSMYRTEQQGRSWVGGLVGALVLFACAGSLWGVLKMLHDARPDWVPILDPNLGASPLEGVALAIVAMIALLITAIGAIVAVTGALGGSLPRAPVFPLPRHLARRPLHLHPYDRLEDVRFERHRLAYGDNAASAPAGPGPDP